MSALVSIQNLSVGFKQGESSRIVAEQINLELFQGQTTALVGESGSGKSVVAHSILRLLPYPTAFHPAGKILFQEQDLLSLPDKQLRRVRGNDIAMIFQEPMTALNPLHTVQKQIGETLKLHQGLSQHQADQETLAWLGKVGIDNPKGRLKSYPHELSGGQRQRVMIAMALANHPKVLIADEPTTALDVTVQKQILELLEDLKASLQMGILLISHDLGVVKRYSDTVAVMHQGRIVEQQPTPDLFKTPQDNYTQRLLSAKPSGSACERPHREGAAPVLSSEALNVKFIISKPLFKPAITFDAVNQASFGLQRGETLGIIGESGSGKSTLAMALLKLIPSSGVIHLKGQRIDNLSAKAIRPYRQNFQVVFQDPFASLSPRMTVAQIIAEGLNIYEPLTEEQKASRVSEILEEVGLESSAMHRYPHEFSGGQRQRIAIARALILKPSVIILDEPTSALDRAVQKQIVDLLRNLQAKYQLSYLFISHDLAVVRALSHRIIVMKRGDIIEAGDTNAVLSNPSHSYTKTLIEAAMIDQ